MKVALFLLLSGLAAVAEGVTYKNTVSVCPKGAKFCCPNHIYDRPVYPHSLPPHFAVVVNGTKKFFSCSAPFTCAVYPNITCPAVDTKASSPPSTGRHLSETNASAPTTCPVCPVCPKAPVVCPNNAPTVDKTGANLIAMCLDKTKPRFCCKGFTTKRPVYPYQCGAPHYAFVRANGTKALHTCPSTAFACVSTSPFAACPAF